MKFIVLLIFLYYSDKVISILMSKYFAKKVNYECKNCKMWSCTYDTDYKNYKIPPYDDFSKYCGNKGE